MANLYLNTLSAANSSEGNATADLMDGFARYSAILGDNAIPTGPDRDIISVDLQKGDIVIAETIHPGGSSSDTYLRFFNQQGNQIDSDDDSAEGQGFEALVKFTALADGKYYIGVSHTNNTTYDPSTSTGGANVPQRYDYDLSVQIRDFNPLEYIASHTDLSNTFGTNRTFGQQHFDARASVEGREVTFDGLEYIASNDDLIFAFRANRDAGSAHFIQNGRFENRARDSFDAQQYLNNYDDLRTAFGNDTEAATIHYITNGFFEGRVDNEVFIG